MRRERLPPTAIVAILTVGCVQGEAARDAMVVRDSAGIEIVESIAAAWAEGAGWSIASQPTLEIGVVDGAPEYLFSNVEGALLLSDGGIAVADRGSAQLRFYDRNGAFEEFVGGSGEGPGEFGYIRGMGRCGGDSIFVFEIDYENVVFSPERAFVREARPFDANTMDRRPYTLRCAASGHYVAIGWERRVADPNAREGPVIGFYRAEAPVWILSSSHTADAARIAEIAHAGLVLTTELGTFLSSERIGTEGGSRPHPFGRATRFAMTRDAVYLGTGESFEIRRYALDGRLEQVIRWPGHDLTIQPADIEAYRAAELERASASQRPAIERTIRDMPMPPAYPAFSRIETDADGNIWVERFRRPGTTEHEWTVLSPAGALFGTLRLPPEFTVFDIGTDAILGVARDDLGVERIRLYALEKAG